VVEDAGGIEAGAAGHAGRLAQAVVTGNVPYPVPYPQEVQAYLVHMLRDEKLAWSTCGVAVHAFRFLYHTTLQRPAATFTVPGPKQPQKLPEILSPEEVRRVIESTANRRQRALLATTYAAGLRVSELVHLKITDIDAQRMSLRVEQGKGAKDRYTLLSARLLDELRAYWRAYRPQGGWLFPSRSGQRPLDMTTVQKIYTAAKLRARIAKRGGIHALRHNAESPIMPSWSSGSQFPRPERPELRLISSA